MAGDPVQVSESGHRGARAPRADPCPI